MVIKYSLKTAFVVPYNTEGKLLLNHRHLAISKLAIKQLATEGHKDT